MPVSPLLRSQFVPPPPPHQPTSGPPGPVLVRAPAGDRIEATHNATSPKPASHHGFGVGLTAGAAAEAGVGAGFGGTASVGAGLFFDGGRGLHPGAFAAAGAFAGVGNQGLTTTHSGDPVGVAGAFAGAGVGMFVTNAASAEQLGGIAQTYSLNLGVGPLKMSVQVGSADGTYLGAVTVGPGIGADVSRYPSSSIASPR